MQYDSDDRNYEYDDYDGYDDYNESQEAEDDRIDESSGSFVRPPKIGGLFKGLRRRGGERAGDGFEPRDFGGQGAPRGKGGYAPEQAPGRNGGRPYETEPSYGGKPYGRPYENGQSDGYAGGYEQPVKPQPAHRPQPVYEEPVRPQPAPRPQPVYEEPARPQPAPRPAPAPVPTALSALYYCAPKASGDVEKIIAAIKEGKAIVCSMAGAADEVREVILYSMKGAISAIDGTAISLDAAETFLIFAPKNVQIKGLDIGRSADGTPCY